jgi:hypothetical protein
MRTLQQTTQEVLDLAAKHFQLPAGSLAPDDDFGIELPDYEVQGVSDFKTLAERIQSRL